MRNWSLDASADGVRWVVLRRHIEDRSLTAETPWVAFEIATEYHALPAGGFGARRRITPCLEPRAYPQQSNQRLMLKL